MPSNPNPGRTPRPPIGPKPPRKSSPPAAARKKAGTKPKANSSNDYMKPVGGTKQEGYMAPGSVLKATGNYSARGKVGESSTNKKGISAYFLAQPPNKKLLSGGINPTALKATRGNPKPTASEMAKGKKATASLKAKQAAAAKAKANAASAAAKKKAAAWEKSKKKPTAGRYKRNVG